MFDRNSTNHTTDQATRILVTGASGFLGRRVARELIHAGQTVRLTGRSAAAPFSSSVEYSPCDLANSTSIASLFRGIDVVIHSAGLAHQHRTWPSHEEYFRVNSAATERVVRAAAQADCRRVVLVSSVAVYGGGWPAKSETEICCPLGPYASSKFDAEQVAAKIADATKLELVILRLATLYGDDDPGNVGRLLRAIDRRRFVWIGRGDNRKSLVHVEDAAHACVQAALRPVTAHRTFNIAAEPCRMREIVTLLAAALGRRLPPLHVPSRLPITVASLAALVPGISGPARRLRATLEKWLSHEVYDATRFRHAYDWSPKVPLAEGLSRQVANYRQAQNATKARCSQQTSRSEPSVRAAA